MELALLLEEPGCTVKRSTAVQPQTVQPRYYYYSMRPKLYDDFTEVGRQTGGGSVYVHFRCPHVGCDKKLLP